MQNMQREGFTMNFLIGQIKDQKILEMEVNLEDFIQENNISESSVIHTMVFDKAVFENEKEVREYLKDKYFYSPIIEDNGNEFTATLISANQINPETEVQVELRRGVIAHAADLVPIHCSTDICFNDKGEINFSSKFGAIDLSEGLPHIIEIARVAEGEHAAYGKISITEETLEAFKNNFESKVTGIDLAVNEDHLKNEAFGWYKDVFLSFDKQILYGQIDWNTKGTTALSEKEYRYFSPEFRFNYVHPHTGVEHGPTLLGGALTNYPFLKMDAITQLNNKQTGEKAMPTIELSVHTEKVVDLNTKLSAAQIELNAKTTENISLSEKVKVLESTIALNAKSSAHEKLFTEGHINAAQLEAMNAGKSMIEVIALSTKTNAAAKGAGKDEQTDVELNDAEKKVAKQMGLTDEQYNAIEL